MKEAYQFPQSPPILRISEPTQRKDTTPFGTLTSTPPNSQTRRATRRDHIPTTPPHSTKKTPAFEAPCHPHPSAISPFLCIGPEQHKSEPNGGPRLRNHERAAKSRFFLVLEELGEDGVADVRAIGQGVFHVDDDDLEGLERKQGWR